MNRKPKRSIYASMYLIVMLVFLAFFAHNPFQQADFDVLNIHAEIEMLGRVFYVRDIFPFYDAPARNAYGDPVRMDIQNYVFKFSGKLIFLLMALGMHALLTALNILLSDIPGRKFVKLPSIIIILIGLFFFELLDFVFFAAQTDWKYEALAVAAALSYVVAFKGEKSGDKNR